MMTVKALTSFVGIGFIGIPGQEITVPDDVGKDLVDAGRAVLVKPDPAATATKKTEKKK